MCGKIFPSFQKQEMMDVILPQTVRWPRYVVIFTGSPIAGPILCFILFVTLWCLNEVAKELENPFGQDANDIPLLDFHLRFTDVLADACNANHHAMLCQPLMGVQLNTTELCRTWV